jgi:hypothetical protein
VDISWLRDLVPCEWEYCERPLPPNRYYIEILQYISISQFPYN